MECCGKILFLVVILGPHITCAQMYLTAWRPSYQHTYWTQGRRSNHINRRVYNPQVRPTISSPAVTTQSNARRDDYIRSLWKGFLNPRRRISTMKSKHPKSSSEIHNIDSNLQTVKRDIPLLAPTTEITFTRRSILDFDQNMEDEKLQMLKLMNRASNGDILAQQKISDLELSRLNDYVGHNQQLADMICQSCSFFADPKKCKLRFCSDGISNKTTT